MSEISRICDHLTCVGASAMELGAFTVFLYMIKAREFLWELVEDVTGARLTISYGRVGGRQGGPPAGLRRARSARPSRRRGTVLEESHKLLTGNRIFMDRMVGRRRRSPARTRSRTGITGPLLRAAGVPFDVCGRPSRTGRTTGSTSRCRSGKNGDNFDRYLVRMAEMEQSMRIAEQALAQHSRAARSTWITRGGRSPCPPSYVDRGKQGKTEGLLLITASRLSPNLAGPGASAHHAQRQRPRQARRAAAEGGRPTDRSKGLMNHFMLVMDGYGIRPPAGRGVLPRRGRQRRARVLRGVRRHGPAVPGALPAAVPAAGGRAPPDDRGRRWSPT